MSFLAEADPEGSLWQQYIHTQFAPDHLLSELGFTVAFELLQLIFIALLWRRVVRPRLRDEIHEELDIEHGIVHHDDHIHENQHEPLENEFYRCKIRPKSRQLG